METAVYDEIKKVVEDNKQEIINLAVQKAKEAISLELSWDIKQQIQDATNEYMKDEILPELTKQMAKNKSKILKELEGVYVGVGAEVAKALQAQVSSNLQHSWNVSKVADGLFK